MPETGEVRLNKLATMIRLAQALAASAEGLTLDEIAREARVGRRTAERMRDTLRDLFPGGFEEITEGRYRRFRITGGLGRVFQSPTADELAELELAAQHLEGSGARPRARLLRSLGTKIQSALRENDRRRLAVDIEALNRGEANMPQAALWTTVDSRTLQKLRSAIKAMKVVSFRYHSALGNSTELRRVAPYGLLFGRSYYMVGPVVGRPDPVMWRLDRIRDIEVTDEPAPVPADFDLWAFSLRSFGAFQEEPADIELSFSQKAADEARQYRFHPSQTLSDEADGSVTVRFRAGGLQELAWHLFTWSAEVTVVSPPRLRELLIDMLGIALEHHRAGRIPPPF